MSFTTAKEVQYLEQTPPIGNTSVTHEVHSFRKVVPTHMDHLISIHLVHATWHQSAKCQRI